MEAAAMPQKKLKTTNPTEPLPADEEQARGGRPMTGGIEPGGVPTGLRRANGVPDREAGAAGAGSGGVLPVGAGGGSGTGAGGLATGLGGVGGTRNMPHSAERPGHSVMPGSSGAPDLEVTDKGLHQPPQEPRDTDLGPDIP
jgi:hypothetical protein